MVKAKVFIYSKPFDGEPKEDNLVLKEEELPPVKNGEFLAEAVYVSVDSYLRAYATVIPLGTVFVGTQVAKSHTIHDGAAARDDHPVFLLSDWKDVPLSYFLGVLGMPGNTAYFGFLEICRPKKGQTVVVSSAAGAVGSVVGQIAKIKGCTVIGIAGSEEKGRWIVNELGFDHFINYKITDIDKALSQLAPNGVDHYFDNIGGNTTNIIIKHLNECGVVSVCGSTSQYNEQKGSVPIDLFQIVINQLRIEGFAVYKWADRFMEGIEQNYKWIREGKLKYRETVVEGFENSYKAFMEIMQGKHIGKTVIKV